MVDPPKSRGLAGLTSIFGITAFILMWIGSIRCNFIKFPVTSGNAGDASMQLGLWYYEWISLLFNPNGTYLFESCNGYPEGVTMDNAWKAARAFSVIAFIFGCLMLIASCVSACSSQQPGYYLTYVWEAPCYFLTALCQGLTLLMLSSNACGNGVLTELPVDALRVSFAETCSISTGAKLNISAMSMWFAAGVASFLAHSAERKEMSGEGDTDLQEPLAPEGA